MRSRRTALRLPFALAADAKIAQISVLPEFDKAEPFARAAWKQLEGFAPNALIGYSFDLARLANAVESGEMAIRTMQRAIFALTDCGSMPMNESLRGKLWSIFGAPVFEWIIAPGCIVLGAECELHNGWHLESGIAAYAVDGGIVYDAGRVNNMHTGFAGALDLTPCECGRSTPRLRDLHPFTRSAEASAALPRAS